MNPSRRFSATCVDVDVYGPTTGLGWERHARSSTRDRSARRREKTWTSSVEKWRSIMNTNKSLQSSASELDPCGHARTRTLSSDCFVKRA